MIDLNVYDKYKSGEEPKVKDLCWHDVINSYVLVDAIVQQPNDLNLLVEVVSGMYIGIKGFIAAYQLMLVKRNAEDWLTWL